MDDANPPGHFGHSPNPASDMTKFLLSLAALALCAPAATAQSQTLPRGFDSVGGGSYSSYPFNSTIDHKWQWHYDSAQFDALGPIQITNVSVRTAVSATTMASFDFPSVELVMASSPTDYTVLGNGIQLGHSSTFANNLNADATVVRPASQWTKTNVGPLTWISFDLTTPFVYDPSLGNDFVLQIDKCGTTISWGNYIDGIGAGAGLNGGNRYGDINACSTATSGFSNNEYVPIVMIEYGPVGPSLAASAGAPGGSMTFDFAGFTPSGTIGVVYGPAGAFVAPGGPCAGLAIELLPINASSPILVGADANGDAQLIQNVPAAGAGLSVQAADIIPGACVASNSIVL